MKKFIVLFILIKSFADAKKYSIPNVKGNWHKAYDYCTSQGMSLASVDSSEEYQALTAFIGNELDCSRSCTVWIGANDLADEGTFTWVSTGNRIRFNSWKSGQPDNQYQREHCVEIIHEPAAGWYWNWNDQECTKEVRLFVCQSVETSENLCISTFK